MSRPIQYRIQYPYVNITIGILVNEDFYTFHNINLLIHIFVWIITILVNKEDEQWEIWNINIIVNYRI